MAERAPNIAKRTDAANKMRQAFQPIQPPFSCFGDISAGNSVLFRKASCTCGGGCPTCHKKLPIQTKLSVSKPGDIFELEADRVADQVMRMPDSSLRPRERSIGHVDEEREIQRKSIASSINQIQRHGKDSDEDEISEDRIGIQRYVSGDGEEERNVPGNFLNNLGQGSSLEIQTRSFFEPRFGHDFGHVRVHNGPQADNAAASVQARAFTLGRDVVFAEGEHDPGSEAGKRLLAHELTHVVQQVGLSASSKKATTVQRTPNPIDARAQALITLAADTSVLIDQRAQNLITQMLATYYPTDVGKFTQINWVENISGLVAVCPSSGTATTTCTLKVGRYFVEHTTRTGISRRVLQLGHEIQHVNQHRQQMGGSAQRHKREFLAFHWEATETEAVGTGRMAHATRVALIDAAIGNYNCLTTTEKTTYDPQYQQLLALRLTEQAASGHPATPVPTACSG